MGDNNDPLAPGPGADAPPRNVPLILLAVFATVFVLDWAQPVLVPLVLGLMTSYALGPVVDRLEKLSIPRGVSAVVLLLSIIGGVGATIVSLQDEAVQLAETLPEAVQKFQRAAREEFGGSSTTLEKVQKAAEELEHVTADPGSTRTARRYARADRAA